MSREVNIQTLFVLFWMVLPSPAQTTLAPADDVEWEALKAHVHRLRTALHALRSPLPAKADQELQVLLEGNDKDSDSRSEKVQKLLDAHCLLGVTINPESRVKAARGPLKAELRQGSDSFVLVKVVNEAGVTHSLMVSGTQVRSAAAADARGWLEAVVETAPPLKKTLGGAKLEYVVLRLRPREAGKREATLKFDVGQGTQDLGFRAEVPVLFTVRPKH
jgi:hypothetical protein